MNKAVVFVAICLFVGCRSQHFGENSSLDPKLDMFGLINVLYLKADANVDGLISSAELEDVYHGFDLNHDGSVTKAEFVGLWTTMTHQNVEHAEAYFYLADLNDDNIIDDHDLNPLYNVFDLDGDGQVTANEFAQKWVGRSDVNKDNHLTSLEFSKFFSSFDANHDDAVNRQEFEAGWTKSGFGLIKEADTFFAHLDGDNNGKLDQHDTLHLFSKYDKNHDHMMMILEATQMSLLIPRPNLAG